MRVDKFMGISMVSFRKKQKILKFLVASILVFLGLSPFVKPQSVGARTNVAEPQAQTHPPMDSRDGSLPFLTTRLAAPLAAPTANPDSANTDEDTTININVLANDVGISLTVTSVYTIGTIANISINPNNTIHYDPTIGLNYLNLGDVYTDTFQYTVSDTTGVATSTVTVTVKGVNDPPVAVNDSGFTTSEDIPINIDVLKNDTDPEHVPLIVSKLITGTAKGAISINQDNTLHYDPTVGLNYLKQGQIYTDTFSYVASDGSLTSNATVSVRVTGVNDPPTAYNDSATTTEDAPVSIPVTSNDTDPDFDPLSVQSVVTPTGFLGKLTITGPAVIFDPLNAFNNLKASQSAIQDFSYTVSDGHGGTSSATVDLTITGVNDNPTPQNDTASTGENTAINIDASTLLSNDTDPEGDSLSISGVITSGTKGSVSWNAASQNVHYNPGTAFDSLAVGATGTDTFQYTVIDGKGGSANATVTVTIIGANDNPIPANDAVSTGENTAIDIAASSLLSNDTDPDTGDTLTISGVITAATKGTVTLNPGNTIVHYDPGMAFNSLSRNQTATDTFDYTVSDGNGGSASATVTVTVIGANDPPIANNDTYVTPANKKLTVSSPGVLANDSDPDSGDTLTGVLVTYPSHGVLSPMPLISGGFVYTPTLNYHGLDHFIYHASDGILSSNDVTVTIGVDVTNQPPMVVADTASTPEDTPVAIPVTANDKDPDGTLNLSTLKVTTQPAHGTTQVYTTTGVITYHPVLNYNGIDAFQYEIYDKDAVLPLSGSAPVTITVTPVNDPPQAANFQTSTTEDTPKNIDLSGHISDVDNNLDLSSLQVITPAGHGTALKSGNPIITYTPASNYNGTDLVGYRICDLGALCAQAKITITVTPVNDPPVAANDQYYTRPISLTVNAPGVLSNDYDVDAGDHMKASLVTNPINGQLKLNEDGSFVYTPNITYGNDRFSYQVYDSQGALSNTAMVTITVDAIPPDVNWQSPMDNGGIYYAYTGQQVPLVITATDNIPIARVEFFWWDPKRGGTGGFVDIANVMHAPFRTLIDVKNLNIGWNQIFARAYDAAGNVNSVVDPTHPGFIWIIRQEKIYLPLLSLIRSP
jgi:VCBS repeat-containing protein